MRIMPAGDSNIAWSNPALPADQAHRYGFRLRLKALLEASGVPVDFVGSCSTGWVNMADCECEWWPGQGISQIAARVTAGMLATYAPDVMVLLIGTNDIRDPGTGVLVSDEQAAVVVTAYRALVAQIIAARPTMWLVILNPGTPIGGSMPIFRAGVLQCYVDQQAAGKLVAYADAQDAASDGLHYSAAGHETIAARLSPVIAGLSGVDVPVPGPVVVPPTPTPPVRVPTQPAGEWAPQCMLNCLTHPPMSAEQLGRGVALSADGTRLFIASQGGLHEYVANPSATLGWERVSPNTVGIRYGTNSWPWVQKLALSPDDGPLYIGVASGDDDSWEDADNQFGGVYKAVSGETCYVGTDWKQSPGMESCPSVQDYRSWYGAGLAISGNGLVLAVGHPGLYGRDLGGAKLSAGYGAVFIFDLDGESGEWVPRAKIPQKDAPWQDRPPFISWDRPTTDLWRECDFWGIGLALNHDGTRLIVGETGQPQAYYTGNVYVFDWTGDPGEEDWVQRQAIDGTTVTQPMAYENYHFGWAICGNADLSRIFIGAPWADNERGTKRGTVFVYEANVGADPPDDLYQLAGRIITPILTTGGDAWGFEVTKNFGGSVACDAAGTKLVVGDDIAAPTTVTFGQTEGMQEGLFLEGCVFVYNYEVPVPVPDEELTPEFPPEDQYYQSTEGPVLLFPYRPLVPVVEALSWTTDAVEAFAGNELRRGARAIPRQSWDWHVLVLDRAWYALFRGLMTGPFWVPTWHEGWLTETQVDPGALTLTVPASVTDYGEWRGQLVLWSSPAWCELIGIASVDGDTITLSTAVTKTYPVGATVMPARLCRMANLVQGQDARGFALLDLSWVLLDAAELEPFQLDAAELMGFLPVAPDGMLDRDLTSAQEETDYQTGVLGFDARHTNTRWSFPALTYRTSRADAWALKLWLYSLQGRRGGFWVPTGKSDVVLASSASATDTSLTIERVNYYQQLFSQADTDRYLHFQRAGLLAPIVRQVTSANPAVGETENITLDEALGIAAEPGTFPYVSWLHPVRLDADRIELSWEAPDRLVVTVPLREVDATSLVE